MSTAATTTASSSNTREATFLLSDWIRRAIEEVDLSALASGATDNVADHPSQWPAIIRNSMALCSDDYLISALRVARSLADQICEAEDFVKQQGNFHYGDGVHSSSSNGNEQPPSSLPAPGNNWADRIYVHLSSDGAEDNDTTKKLHFRIEKADLMPPDDDDAEKGQIEDDGMRRIYSLGIVFYQIFSGGERPSELLLEQQSASSRNTEITDSFSQSQETSENNNWDHSNPLHCDHHNGEPDIVDLNDVGGEDDFFNVENPRKRQTQSCHYTVYDVSVEPLKAKCIPVSMCDLVANMIDCAHASPSGDDSYHNMSEVRDDLQLMLEKPAIYLYDQDMGRLSTTGLQFGDRVFGRNAELSTVKDAYRRSAAGGCELVIISGASGYGKSLLANEFRKHVLAGGGIVLSGKFDQLQQGEPFSALASAFDVYCGVLLQDSGPSSRAEVLASKLRSSMGSEAYYLAKLIPNLATILMVREASPMNHNEDCDNAQKRLQYLLCQFLQVISSTFSAPITLFLDDLQWADPASIEAVNQLLITAGPSSRDKCFFFLGCCREGAINEEHPVWKLLRNADTLSVGCTNIILDLMDEQTINTMVSETLCLSPRLTRSLSSIIYHKTKGNPLFVSRLMLSLSEEGLLRPSLSRRRWEWDREKIERQKLPDNVAMFLNKSIRELPENVQSSLCVLSCFGASADVFFIRTLERALHQNILDDLDVAVAKGLLDKIGALYRFSHDRIQEATYNMMQDQARRLLHFTFGLSLASLSIDEGNDGILFIAVNQLNHGGPSAVQDPSQSFTVADMNLRAGKKAMEMSDFKIASSYFDHGISFLRNNHWTEHYNLSLELFELAAKCAVTNGNHSRVKLLYEQVLTEARSFEDKLDVTYSNIRALFDASSLEEALTKLLYVLNELGIVLSGDLTTMLPDTKSMLAQYSDEQLLSRPVMTDRTKLMAMKFLSIVQLCLFHTNPKSQPKATLQVVQYSLRHGMSGLSSVGFVFYGSFLACLGEIPAGYRYVKIAIKLAEKMGATDCMGDVLAVGSQVMGYVEPLQSVNDLMIRGHEYGLLAGNISSAMLSLAMSVVCDYWSGKPLSLVKSTMDDILRRMSSKSTLALIQTLPLYRSALAMIGNVDDVSMIIGTEEERKMRETTLHLLKVVHFNKMYVGFMFRRYNDVKQLADAYDAITSLSFSIILISDYMHVFYGGLINFWIARKTGDAIWFDRGEGAIQKMRSYANCSSWNFKNKLLLLQAEQSFHLEDFESAKCYYDDAITSAKEFKFVHEEALACELAGYFLSERGEENSSLSYFLRARRKYHEWGAYAKEESLKTYIEEHYGVINEEETETEWEILPRISAEPRKRRAS